MMILYKEDDFGNMIEERLDHDQLRQRAGQSFFAGRKTWSIGQISPQERKIKPRRQPIKMKVFSSNLN